MCGRCSTPCLEDRDHMAQCPKCFFVFCGMCKDAWHPGREVGMSDCRVQADGTHGP